jgi:hypothetical protein
MRTPRFVLVPILLAAIACTSGETSSTPASTPGAGTSSTPTALSTVNASDVRQVPGRYTYANEGVTVDLSWSGEGTGTLTIQNKSGGDLQPPGLYAVTPTGAQVHATVQNSKTISNGDSVTLTVTFPATLKPEDAGLIALLFGDQDWGALSPVVTQGSVTISP